MGRVRCEDSWMNSTIYGLLRCLFQKSVSEQISDEAMEGIEFVEVFQVSSKKGGLEYELENTVFCDSDAVRWIIRVRQRGRAVLKPEWISLCAHAV